MSTSVFPALPLVLLTNRDPISRTTIQETVSGGEYTTSWGVPSKFRYRLRGKARSGVAAPAPWAASTETGIIYKFHVDHRGEAESFLWVDPYDGATVRVRFDGDPSIVRTNIPTIYDVEITLRTSLT